MGATMQRKGRFIGRSTDFPLQCSVWEACQTLQGRCWWCMCRPLAEGLGVGRVGSELSSGVHLEVGGGGGGQEPPWETKKKWPGGGRNQGVQRKGVSEKGCGQPQKMLLRSQVPAWCFGRNRARARCLPQGLIGANLGGVQAGVWPCSLTFDLVPAWLPGRQAPVKPLQSPASVTSLCCLALGHREHLIQSLPPRAPSVGHTEG